MFLAHLHNPAGLVTQLFHRLALRHDQDARRIYVLQSAENFSDLFEIHSLIHDEFELVIVPIDKFLDDLQVKPSFFVHFSELTLLFLPRGRIGELGTERNEITRHGLENRRRGFDRYMSPGALERRRKFLDFRRQQWLAARYDDVTGRVLTNLSYNFF